VKITIESTLRMDVIEQFYDLYVMAFTPLQTNAAARHMLTFDEFAEEMTDPRIEKHVAWNRDGEAVALTTLTTDLAAVPWISPHYFAHRYPEHAARGAIFYLGYTLVHPEHEGTGVLARVTVRIFRRMTEARGVLAFDVCGYNDATHQIGQTVANLSRSLDMKMDRVDVQSYYAATFNGPKKKESVNA
jgi:hypothetical protein